MTLPFKLKWPTSIPIQESKAGITLISTVSHAALQRKRRVFHFGDIFYAFHKGVSRIANPARLHDFLRAELSRPIDRDDAYNEDFVWAYHSMTYPGTLNLIQRPDTATSTASQVYFALQTKAPGGIKRTKPASTCD